VISRAHAQFWKCLEALPEDIQRITKEKYRLWAQDNFHSSLHFKPLLRWEERDKRLVVKEAQSVA